jgi:hypothetical protein
MTAVPEIFGMEDLDAAEQEMLSGVMQVCPAFEPSEVIYRSRTSLVAAGGLDGEPVIAKMRTPQWRQHALREIEAYRLFATDRPPVRVPRCHGADPDRGVLVLERIPGDVVAPDRFPAVPLPATALTEILAVSRRLSRWRPDVPDGWRTDYGPMLDGLHARGVFGEAAPDVERLADLAGEPRQICHGDLALANVIQVTDGYALIDWASCGVYLPGLDLAQLWLLLGDSPGARRQIDDAAEDAPPDQLAAFLLNLTMLLYRERRAHQRFDDPRSRLRAVQLDTDWAETLGRARRHGMRRS